MSTQRNTPYTSEEIDAIIGRLQSVPGIRTLQFREGRGYPHLMVIKQDLSFYFWLAPRRYAPKEGEYDYKYWLPATRSYVVSSAEEVIEKLHLKVPPGTIQTFKKRSLFIEHE